LLAICKPYRATSALFFKKDSIMFLYITGGGRGKLTQTAGTRIQALIGGVGKFFTCVTNFRVTTAGTAHTVTLMRGASRTSVATELAAAGTALVVAAALTDGAGAAIAANDLVGVRLDDGSWHLSVVSAWTSGTLTITLATAIPTGRTAKKGALVVNYGVAGDAFHSAHQHNSGAGATNNFPAVAVDAAPLVHGTGAGEPILLDIDNATAASTLEQCSFGCMKY
jgi:hypothetical protein